MSRITLLGAILTVQLLLAIGLLASSNSGSDGFESSQLLAFATTGVDRIEISDTINNTTLLRSDGAWRLQEPSLPANGVRIQTLLDTLAGLQTTWPVVDTASGRERLQVSEDNFQRRLALYSGDELLGEYYFGTSPGFRQTHGRRSGEDEVYTLAFNNFDLPGDSNDWLDKTLLAVDAPDRISGPDYAISRNENGWQLTDSAASDADVQLDETAVNELVSAVQNLRVLRAESVPAGEGLALEVSVGDNSWQYHFTEADNRHYVQRADLAQGFTINASDFERIAGLTRAELLGTGATDAGADTGAEEDQP